MKEESFISSTYLYKGEEVSNKVAHYILKMVMCFILLLIGGLQFFTQGQFTVGLFIGVMVTTLFIVLATVNSVKE